MSEKQNLTDPRLVQTMMSVLAILAFWGAPAASQPGGGAFTRQAGDQELQWGPCPDFLPEGCEIAVLQGDPAEHNADIFFRLPGGAVADRHWHRSAERMVLVSGELQVDYDGQDSVVLEPGTYAYGPAELPHSAECHSAEPCVLFIAFEQPVDAFPGEPE